LYSDFNRTHDAIVGIDGAFNKAIKGIHNLGLNDYRIEIRTIPQKLNCSRLYKFAHYVYRNLTFVEHVTFMGIEMIGHAVKNKDRVWVDPIEFMEELEKAIYFLNNSGICVSLFNFPHCILTPGLREFSRISISDWKRVYYKKCESCIMRNKCGGVFFSSKELLKHFINPVIN
jgi:His-Xaa-Ser system radical SAM maturase HxsC